jgi:hypothetical protein
MLYDVNSSGRAVSIENKIKTDKFVGENVVIVVGETSQCCGRKVGKKLSDVSDGNFEVVWREKQEKI